MNAPLAVADDTADATRSTDPAAATALYEDGPMLKMLRNNMVDRLVADGVVADGRIATALRDTPRHFFAPQFTLPGPDGEYQRHTQIAAGATGNDLRAAAWAAMYSADTVPVVAWADDGTPRVVMESVRDLVRLLDLAQIRRGRSVLQIGTGTGFTLAVLAHLTGSLTSLTTVELDAFAHTAAMKNFAANEYSPYFVCGDGRGGYAPRGPYATVFSTCDVARVPGAWVRQCTPDGRIVTTMAGQPIALNHSADPTMRTVSGRFAAGAPMKVTPLRERPPGASTVPMLAELSELASRGGRRREAYVPDKPFQHPTLRWLLRLMLPEVVFTIVEHEGAPHFRLLDPFSQSWVNAYPDATAPSVIQEGGTRPLWDDVMRVYTEWAHAARPEPQDYGLTATEHGHHALWLGDPSHVVASLSPEQYRRSEGL